MLHAIVAHVVMLLSKKRIFTRAPLITIITPPAGQTLLYQLTPHGAVHYE